MNEQFSDKVKKPGRARARVMSGESGLYSGKTKQIKGAVAEWGNPINLAVIKEGHAMTEGSRHQRKLRSCIRIVLSSDQPARMPIK